MNVYPGLKKVRDAADSRVFHKQQKATPVPPDSNYARRIDSTLEAAVLCQCHGDSWNPDHGYDEQSTSGSTSHSRVRPLPALN